MKFIALTSRNGELLMVNVYQIYFMLHNSGSGVTNVYLRGNISMIEVKESLLTINDRMTGN
jgi:hypothetical protein